MTRPIYEPTPARKDSYLEFQTDQLFRRPAPPASEATIPGFHGWMTEDLVLTTGNDGQLAWDFWIIDDGSIFDATTITGGDATDVTLLIDGWYSIDCWALFSSAPATGFAGIMMIHDDTDVLAPAESQGVTYPLNFHLDTALKFTKVAYFPPVFLTQDPPSFAWADRLEFWVVQNAGINRTITAAYLNIGFLGPRESVPSS